MDLKRLYVVVYKVQDRENFAKNIYVLISRDNFLEIHKQCKRMRAHLQKGARYFNELEIDGVTVGWSYSVCADQYVSGRLK